MTNKYMIFVLMNDINFVNKLSFVVIFTICNIIVNNDSQVLVVSKWMKVFIKIKRRQKKLVFFFLFNSFLFIAVPIAIECHPFMYLR